MTEEDYTKDNKDIIPLTREEIVERLTHFPGWTYFDSKLHKTFEFKSFSDGIKLLSELAPFCDSVIHHPDIVIEYNKITFSLNRYDIGGKVISMDFIIAQKIEDLYNKYANNVS